MKHRSWVLLAVAAAAIVVLGAGAGPASAASQPKFNVFAAASLYKAFPAMVAPFKAKYPQYKNVKFVFNFQGTDVLVAQIEGGAPADLFAGASTKYGTALLTDKGGPYIRTPRFFVQNKLCVIVPKANVAGIATLADLTKPGIVIAIGNAAVPIGSYTQTVLTNITNAGMFGPSYASQVNANVQATLGNVNQVTALVSLNEVDAGFVYNSDYVAAQKLVKKIAIPNTFLSGTTVLPIQTVPLPTYPIATVRHTGHATLANLFISYCMSSKGQGILEKWGFLGKPYPIIASVSPTSGAPGSTVTIKGTNFFTPGTVTIGGTTATTTAWSPTSIKATVPAGLAAGATTVSVTADGRVVKHAATFTVTPTP